MRCAILLAIFAAVALADGHGGVAHPRWMVPAASNNVTTCRTGMELVTEFQNRYNANATVPKTVCILADHEEACPTPRGVVACSKTDAACRVSDRSRNKKANPVMANVVDSQEISECLSAGAKIADDANVLVIAQTVCSISFILPLAIFAFIRCRGAVDPFVATSYWLTIIFGFILLPSFYYLNALVAFTAVIAATSLLSTKDATASGLGIAIVVLALFWISYNSGLGSVDHMMRINNDDLRNPRSHVMEKACNEYYRGSFVSTWETNDEDYNRNFFGKDLCSREWLAAAYFFSMFLRLLLSMFIAAAARALVMTNEKKKESKQE